MDFQEFWWAIDSARLQEEVSWRRTREIVAMIHNTNSKRRKKAKDLIPLSIDTSLLVVKHKRISFTEFKKRYRNGND